MPAALFLMTLLGLLLPARPAAAHPLDVYLQATYLTVAASAVDVELDLSPGVLVAPAVLDAVDVDHDAQVTDAEARSYAVQFLRDVELRVDGQPLTLQLSRVEVSPYLTLQAGYGTLKVYATVPSAPATTGSHELFFRNGSADPNAKYQVNVLLDEHSAVQLGVQRRDADQRQTTTSYVLPATTSPPPSSRDSASAHAAPVQGNRLLAALDRPSTSAGALLVALVLAALLGALHALTPGHAKTLMAAYLVANGGTARDAMKLGAVVTFTHTASVVVLGLVALLAGQLLVPGILVPALELTSGLLVLVLGLRLVKMRWTGRRGVREPAPDRPVVLAGRVEAGEALTHHAHHGHDHGQEHEHGGVTHSHTLSEGRLTPRGLVALGVSGGLVPCPEALGVMIVAVGLHRAPLGLGLVLAFSTGLAAVLIGLGLLLVRSRGLAGLLDRVTPRWAALLPLASAVLVTVLGALLVLRGLDHGQLLSTS